MDVSKSGRAIRLLTLIAGLWVLGVVSGGGRADGAQGGGGHLAFQEEAVRFAGVYPGELVEYVFRFRNEGDVPVRILSVKPT